MKHTTVKHTTIQAHHDTSTPKSSTLRAAHWGIQAHHNTSQPQAALVVQAHHGVAAGLLQRNRRFGNLDGQLELSNG